ncbi:cysteine hydrolase family protein [Paenibacillus protaetiae]|uniref:Cysteine hydrolase n=1 Tax=Paenibacillus protaetiae TaxID=2509456 RepID=A0A4V0YEX6_9BACL|nr:isochorismatase family cysteine hydrolase [Paenibacillus protaetiae]QAY65741.1 cysteine hydrolase [Paenibacillus protaetiae]
MRIALLIVDMQKKFICNEDIDRAALIQTSEYINQIADSLRANGHYVVHIRDVEDWTEETADSYEMIAEVKTEESDLHISKLYSNAFWHTELELTLRERNVQFVIVAGYASEYSVLFTYNGAREQGFKSVILQDGIICRKDNRPHYTVREQPVIYSAKPFLAEAIG